MCFYTVSPLLLQLFVSAAHDPSFAFHRGPETGIDAAEYDLHIAFTAVFTMRDQHYQ